MLKLKKKTIKTMYVLAIILSLLASSIVILTYFGIKPLNLATDSSMVFSSNKVGEVFRLIGEDIKPFSVIFDRECIPDSGFDRCYEIKRDESYGDARAEAYAKVQGNNLPEGKYIVGTNYWVGDVSVSTNFVGDIFYFYENIPSWDSIWNNCNENGCSGYKKTISSNNKIILASPGQEYIGCPSFVSFDYSRNDASNGDWVYVYVTKGYGWVGNNCLDIKSVRCYDDFDCGINEKCDKSNNWNEWSCKSKPSNKIQGWACTEDSKNSNINIEWKGKSIITDLSGSYAIQDAEIGSGFLIYSKIGYTTFEYPFDYSGGLVDVHVDKCQLCIEGRSRDVYGNCVNNNECPIGQIKCSDGVCRENCNQCINNQVLCDDGTCKDSCEEKINYFVMFIVILVIIFIVVGLSYFYIYSLKSRRKR